MKNQEKKISDLLSEVASEISERLPKKESDQLVEKLCDIEALVLTQIASERSKRSEGIVAPKTSGETAKSKIRAYLMAGNKISSHKANRMGITSQGNQIITALRREGVPVLDYLDHNDKGHYFKVYYIDPNYLEAVAEEQEQEQEQELKNK